MTLWWYSYEPWEKFMRTGEGIHVSGTADTERRLYARTKIDTRADELAELLGSVDLGT